MRTNTLFAVCFVLVGVGTALSAATVALTGGSTRIVAVLALPVCLAPVAAWATFHQDEPQTRLARTVHRVAGVVLVCVALGAVLFGLWTLRAAL
jgi:uncharacterized membrane protein